MSEHPHRETDQGRDYDWGRGTGQTGNIGRTRVRLRGEGCAHRGMMDGTHTILSPILRGESKAARCTSAAPVCGRLKITRCIVIASTRAVRQEACIYVQSQCHSLIVVHRTPKFLVGRRSVLAFRLNPLLSSFPLVPGDEHGALAARDCSHPPRIVWPLDSGGEQAGERWVLCYQWPSAGDVRGRTSAAT